MYKEKLGDNASRVVCISALLMAAFLSALSFQVYIGTAVEDRGNISFWDKRQICLVSKIIKMSPSRSKAGHVCLNFPLGDWGLLNLTVPQLRHKPAVCAASAWAPSLPPWTCRGKGANANMKLMLLAGP